MSLTDMVIMPGADYQDACEAIREKTGGTGYIRSGEMGGLIRGISSGNTDIEDSLVERTVVEYTNNRVTSIGSEAFAECYDLESVSFPLVTDVGGFAFYLCTNLKSVDIPSATTIRSSAFSDSSLEKAVFPSVTNVESDAFDNCTSLWLVDLPSVTRFDTLPFGGCTAIKAFVLRATDSVVTLRKPKMFDDTLIAAGSGYIYAPRALVDSYKTATYWANFAAQFRALEDYTVDGTTTGALNENLI